MYTFSAILLWSSLKELWEDWQRRRSDAAVNELPSRVMSLTTDGEEALWEEDVPWRDIEVGQLIALKVDELKS